MRAKLTLALTALLIAVGSIAYAKSIEDTLGGTIILTQKSIPNKFNNANDFKKLAETKFDYAQKDPITKTVTGKITLNYVVFLKKAITSSAEVSILDTTDGLPGNIVLTTPFYTSERDQRILASYLDIDEKTLPGNRKYRMVFTYRNSVLAKVDFTVKAKAVKYDGKVDFSDEETKK